VSKHPSVDFSEGTVWTSVKNNLSPQTSVSAVDQEGKAVLRLDYNMSTEQVPSLSPRYHSDLTREGPRRTKPNVKEL